MPLKHCAPGVMNRRNSLRRNSDCNRSHCSMRICPVLPDCCIRRQMKEKWMHRFLLLMLDRLLGLQDAETLSSSSREAAPRIFSNPGLPSNAASMSNTHCTASNFEYLNTYKFRRDVTLRYSNNAVCLISGFDLRI